MDFIFIRNVKKWNQFMAMVFFSDTERYLYLPVYMIYAFDPSQDQNYFIFTWYKAFAPFENAPEKELFF